MNKPNKSRIIWLDIARGICIICMIMVHAFEWSRRAYWFTTATGYWFLVFFFLCSGICFSNKHSLKDYIVVKFKKLYLPYLLVTTTYLLYRVQTGLWWDYSNASKVKSLLTTIMYSLSIDIQFDTTSQLSTIGVGPIWFLPCLFVAGILYKLLYNAKGKLPICIALACIAAYSQKHITLPFLLQDACIGCMFIAIGDSLKEYIFKFINWLNKLHVIVITILCTLSFILYYFIVTHLPYQIINLGGNTYSICSLISSLLGFLFLIILSIIVEKTRILDEFLAFCGKETLLIVILHTFDILILRNWSMRDNSFLVGTILLYTFTVYFYRKIQTNIKEKLIPLFATYKNRLPR